VESPTWLLGLMGSPGFLSLAVSWETALCFIKEQTCPEREQLRKISVLGGKPERENICETDVVLSVEGRALQILS